MEYHRVNSLFERYKGSAPGAEVEASQPQRREQQPVTDEQSHIRSSLPVKSAKCYRLIGSAAVVDRIQSAVTGILAAYPANRQRDDRPRCEPARPSPAECLLPPLIAQLYPDL